EVKKAAPAKKAPAKKAADVKATVAVQFAGKDYSAEQLVKMAKAAYKATKNKEEMKKLEVYVNVDDSRAYYVVNGVAAGSFDI
ncbi:MAG: DUF6465 family protein, partial [Lachnospiraceae bacterium]|nr:DUF6465 family protein [Lachnospiraceae bacterium]